MTHSVDHRLATVAIGTALAVPLLAGDLYAADILPELLLDASKIALAPAFLLDTLLKTNVLYGGVANLWGLFPIVSDTPPLAWRLGIVLLVSYAAAFVGVQTGIASKSHTDWFTQRTWMAPVVGTAVTIGVVSFVGMTVKRFARDPIQRQEFHPQPVAGALTLALLVVVAVLFYRTRETLE